MTDLPRGTVTLLHSDVAGSTQLVRRLGDAYPEVEVAHDRLLRAAFAAHGGHVFGAAGDSFFVAFPRAGDAIAAAAAGQRALAAHRWPEGAAVRVRMGLHTGEPAVVDERYVGLELYHTVRLATAAHGGQVLISAAARAVLHDRLPAGRALRDLGEYRLMDGEPPERVYQLLLPDLPADFPPLRPPALPAAGALAGLTAREVEVLRLVARGLSDAEVAARLGVSVHTVKTHLRSTYGKLAVPSRSAATRFALEHGLT